MIPMVLHRYHRMVHFSTKMLITLTDLVNGKILFIIIHIMRNYLYKGDDCTFLRLLESVSKTAKICRKVMALFIMGYWIYPKLQNLIVKKKLISFTIERYQNIKMLQKYQY